MRIVIDLHSSMARMAADLYVGRRITPGTVLTDRQCTSRALIRPKLTLGAWSNPLQQPAVLIGRKGFRDSSLAF